MKVSADQMTVTIELEFSVESDSPCADCYRCDTLCQDRCPYPCGCDMGIERDDGLVGNFKEDTPCE
jgi:hypothetical protein